MDNIIVTIVFYGLFFGAVIVNIIDIIWSVVHHKPRGIRINRITASVIAANAGIISFLHGYMEILHSNDKINGLLFEANTGRSLIDVPTNDWKGWIAMTIIPNYFITGIIVIIISIIFMVWGIAFIKRRNGGIVLILLSFALFAVGGGFIPPTMGIIAGVFGMQIKNRI